MGTNYHYHPSGERTCPHCRQASPALHVGKSSVGWNFSLRVHPDEGIVDLDTWRERWDLGGAIFDEYGDPVTPEKMLATITDRVPDYGGSLRSHAGLSGNGWRSEARYGGPTWDLCDYEFS